MNESKKKEEKFHTIRSYLTSFLDDKTIRIFPMVPSGNFYAATRKANGDLKKAARGTIIFPSDGSLGKTEDLRFLREWSFTIIAIPKKTIEKLKQ